MKSKVTKHCRKTVPSKTYMRCSKCNSMRSTTSQTGAGRMGDVKGIARVRTCHDCGERWKTLEIRL